MIYFMEWEGMCINCDLYLNDRQLVDPSIFWTHSLCSESLSDVFIPAQWARASAPPGHVTPSYM